MLMFVEVFGLRPCRADLSATTPTANVRNLKLMPDYDCDPIWKPGALGSYNVNPADLPISADLQAALHAWAQRYDDTLDRDDPRQSGFPSLEAATMFEAEGKMLLERLQTELGQEYVVTLKVFTGVKPKEG